MITIEQLLESVDLDFEPRFVTKDPNGMVWLWETKPVPLQNGWGYSSIPSHTVGFIKLSEFDGKDCTECIYEVPRKNINIKFLHRENMMKCRVKMKKQFILSLK